MQHNRKIIYLAGFLVSLPVALMSYVNSSFLSSFVGESKMGITYIFASVVSIIGLLVAPHILKKLGVYRFLLLITALNALSILCFVIFNIAWIILTAFVVGFTLNLLIAFSIDEFLKIFSPNASTGKTRGIYIALINIAWILSQILSVFGSRDEISSLRNVYLMAFYVMTAFFLFSLFAFKNVSDPDYDKIKSLGFVKKFFSNKNLFRAYIINFLLQFFYAIMIIYTPIYLHTHIGFSWSDIAIIFAFMLTPFLFLPAFEGMYADSFGERKMLMFGFFIASVSTISLFFIKSTEIWIWAVVLFCTRVGAATIEVMSDAYFFKHIKPENEEWIGVFRSSPPVSYILAPLVALVIFAFVPSFNYIFLVLGAVMLKGIYIASTIKPNDI